MYKSKLNVIYRMMKLDFFLFFCFYNVCDENSVYFGSR